jgi:MFS family permease
VAIEPTTSRDECRRESDVALRTAALEQAEAISPQIQPGAIEMPRVIRALRNRNFRYFWIGNFLSNIGTWMQSVAQGWLVLELASKAPPEIFGSVGQRSAFWLGLVAFAASAPMLAFTLIGGVIADRVDKRRLLIRTQSVMMLSALAMSGLSFAKVINIPEIVLLAFLTGTAMSLNMPGYQALVPSLVPREDLTNAIALNSAQFNMSRVLGPTIGGFVMAWWGIPANFFLNALSFSAVIFALTQIEYPAQPQQDDSAGLWQRLGEGFRYVLDRRQMSSLLLLVALASIFGVPFLMFVPLFAKDILQVGERGLGLLMACSGAGAFLAAATIAYLGKIKCRGRFVVISASIFFAAIIAFTFSRHFALSGAMLAIAGYCMILTVATVNTLLQHLAEDAMRGRVMSIYATAFLGFAPIGSLIAGSLAGAITAPIAIAAMSAIAMLGTWALYLSRPELRQLD